jgi:hypothetical protein
MSSSLNFECHVTLVPSEDPSWVKTIEGIAEEHKFKTSFIVGDPLLGKAKYFYLTAHDKTYNGLMGRMQAVVDSLPTKPVRLKIEQILYDERF